MSRSYFSWLIVVRKASTCSSWQAWSVDYDRLSLFVYVFCVVFRFSISIDAQFIAKFSLSCWLSRFKQAIFGIIRHDPVLHCIVFTKADQHDVNFIYKSLNHGIWGRSHCSTCMIERESRTSKTVPRPVVFQNAQFHNVLGQVAERVKSQDNIVVAKESWFKIYNSYFLLTLTVNAVPNAGKCIFLLADSSRMTISIGSSDVSLTSTPLKPESRREPARSATASQETTQVMPSSTAVPQGRRRAPAQGHVAHWDNRLCPGTVWPVWSGVSIVEMLPKRETAESTFSEQIDEFQAKKKTSKTAEVASHNFVMTCTVIHDTSVNSLSS